MGWPLLSLRVGTPVPLGPHGRPSAIDKHPVAGAVYLDYTGLASDQQGDPIHHGGPEKAVHHYAAEHYAVWQAELAAMAGVQHLDIGGFGENLSTSGLTEADVAVGDTFSLGAAVIQVSQPRQPCWKLNVRFNVPDMALKVQASGRTGWYYRVLEPGLVRSTDTLRRIARPNADWTLQRVLHVLYRDRLNMAELRQLAVLPQLTQRMRDLAAARLRDASVENWTPRLEGKAPVFAQADAVVRFWRAAGPQVWFEKDTAFDDAFRERFLDLHFAVARREHEAWLSDAYASLALILMLDQFPRNAFRGSAHSYATDGLAKFYANATLESNRIDAIDDALKLFVVLPFIHSERIDDQRRGVALYRRYSPASLDFALEHCEIIERFGRLPHRNAALGRITTQAEQRFLDDGGFAG